MGHCVAGHSIFAAVKERNCFSPHLTQPSRRTPPTRHLCSVCAWHWLLLLSLLMTMMHYVRDGDTACLPSSISQPAPPTSNFDLQQARRRHCRTDLLVCIEGARTTVCIAPSHLLCPIELLIVTDDEQFTTTNCKKQGSFLYCC